MINVKHMHAASESDTDLSDQLQPLQKQGILLQAMQKSQCHHDERQTHDRVGCDSTCQHFSVPWNAA